MIDKILSALISAGVSALISGIGVYYLHAFLSQRAEANDAARKKRREERQKCAVLDARWKHAVGRVLFWLKDSADKGREHANGYMDEAFQELNTVESETKSFEQTVLAEHNDENRA